MWKAKSSKRHSASFFAMFLVKWMSEEWTISVVKMSTFWEFLLNQSSHMLLHLRTTIPLPFEKIDPKYISEVYAVVSALFTTWFYSEGYYAWMLCHTQPITLAATLFPRNAFLRSMPRGLLIVIYPDHQVQFHNQLANSYFSNNVSITAPSCLHTPRSSIIFRYQSSSIKFLVDFWSFCLKCEILIFISNMLCGFYLNFAFWCSKCKFIAHLDKKNSEITTFFALETGVSLAKQVLESMETVARLRAHPPLSSNPTGFGGSDSFTAVPVFIDLVQRTSVSSPSASTSASTSAPPPIAAFSNATAVILKLSGCTADGSVFLRGACSRSERERATTNGEVLHEVAALTRATAETPLREPSVLCPLAAAAGAISDSGAEGEEASSIGGGSRWRDILKFASSRNFCNSSM